MSFGHTDIAYMQFHQRAHDSSMAKRFTPFLSECDVHCQKLSVNIVNILTTSSIKNKF